MNKSFGLQVVENPQTTSIVVTVGSWLKQFTTAKKDDGWMVYVWETVEKAEASHPCLDKAEADSLVWGLALEWGRRIGATGV